MVFKTARRMVIAVVGSTVVLIGVVMIVLPGPAILVVPAGLAILATEFAWARRLLKRLKQQAQSVFHSGSERERDKSPTAKRDTRASSPSLE